MEPWEEWAKAACCEELSLTQRHLAFARLVERFEAEIYTRALRTLCDAGLAQDVTQETFLIAYQHLSQLRAARAFPRWLQQILRTQCNRLYRQPAPPTSPLEAHHELSDGALDTAQLVVGDDVRELVMAAIAALPPHERSIVHLFYLQGFSLREVAERLKLPATTVKKRLQTARGRMRQRIDEVRSAGVACWQAVGDRLIVHTATLLVALVALLGWPLLAPSPVLVTCPRRVGYFQPSHEFD